MIGCGFSVLRTALVVFLVALALIFVSGGCKKSGDTTETTGSGGDTKGEQKKEVKATPEELAKQAFDLYEKSMGQLVEMLKDKPEPDEVREKVAEFKEQTIQKMFAIGKIRETFDEAGKNKFNNTVAMSLGRVNREIFDKYMELSRHYVPLDREFQNDIAAFNIITQYTNFDLLKEQSPAEAERLGIK